MVRFDKFFTDEDKINFPVFEHIYRYDGRWCCVDNISCYSKWIISKGKVNSNEGSTLKLKMGRWCFENGI